MNALHIFSLLLFVNTITAADVTYLFSHGLGANGSQAKEYMTTPFNAQWIIADPVISLDFPDATTAGFDPAYTSLGQENEITTLKKAYELGAQSSHKLIVMGLSRGASAVVNLLATCKTDHIAAVILESPFDSIACMIERRIKHHKLWWIPQFVSNKAPEFIFKQYKSQKLSPIDYVKQIPNTVPLLFVCSLEDTLIDAQGTCNLYLALKNAGHKHAYLLLLNKGAHAQLFWHNDRDWYLYVVHAFYEKYQLPHDKEFAVKGRALLAHCQPEEAVVLGALKNKKSYLGEKE